MIKASNLIKDYEIGEFIVRAVDNVNLEIKEGEFIAIKGPSGAGKTTLLNLLGGLDTPTEGVIYSFGVKISDMSEESLTVFRLMNSGFIFQDFSLISTLTAEENVMFPMSLLDIELETQREIAVKLLKDVGLGKRREHLPFQLSAGEKQRVAIVRALANDPPFILADEPTANLDQKTVVIIQEFFKNIKKMNKTVIIATHDDYLINIADKILNFEEGQIVNE
ncbi:MAG: ABC transporter ATP-binding protein [Promethearchaeota archaeon]|nr:MAG: ABC transporter ATP-binding protein [Candidatus Lokiarchaeota archaeon]